MKVATWNVNSLRARQDAVLDWVEANEPDVLCLQETKLSDQEFPEDEFGDLDCDAHFWGQKSYNGVAIITPHEAQRVIRGFQDPAWDEDKRVIAARVNGIDVIDIYLPNGQSYGSDKYRYKLEWMDRLVDWLDQHFDPEDPVLLCGDFNIAPTGLDHCGPEDSSEQLFTSEGERTRYRRFLDWGFVDAFRHLHPQERAYTWWDYRGMAFQRNEGMRIDHVLVTPSLLARLNDVTVHRALRSEEAPSDHVPVVAEFDP